MSTHRRSAVTATIAMIALAPCCGGPGALPEGFSRVEVKALSGVGQPSIGDGESSRANLLLVSIDTLRADHVSAYGYGRDTTPNLDRLAGQGVLFERAFAAAPRTAQSHMSLFTGLYPAEHGVKNFQDGGGQRLDASVPTLATVLRANGYDTAAYVGGGNIAGSLGFDQGFETYVHGRRTFELATDFLEQRVQHEGPDDTPFFLFVHTYQAHDPYVAATEENRRLFTDPGYEGSIYESWEELAPQPDEEFEGYAKRFWDSVDMTDPADLRHLVDLYDACIRSVDDSLGNLMAALRDVGLEQETIVIVLSDHGEEFSEHGGFLHETLHHEVLHVPLVFRFPGTRESLPRRVEAQARLIDVMPTILDALRIPTPEHAQGVSLARHFTEPSSEDLPAFAQFDLKRLRSLRSGGWTLIEETPLDRDGGFLGLGRLLGGSASRFNLYEGTDVNERDDLAESRGDLAESLAAEIARARAIMDRNAEMVGNTEDATLDEETLRQLEALGYVGD